MWYLIFVVVASIIVGIAAETHRNRSGFGWFMLSFLISLFLGLFIWTLLSLVWPILVGLWVLALPKKEQVKRMKRSEMAARIENSKPQKPQRLTQAGRT